MTSAANPRGTSNSNDRGGSEQRRRRKQWLIDEFGDGELVVCRLCWRELLDFPSVTVDRFPVPGSEGGRYVRGNIRPVSARCNSVDGNAQRWSRDRLANEASAMV